MIEYKKIGAILLIAFSLLGCTANKASWTAEAYTYAEECMERGDMTQALLYYNISSGSAREADSIPYWWKAMYGEGKIYFMNHKLQDAKENFEKIWDFAQRHSLDTAQFIALTGLSDIAYQNGVYAQALFHLQKADSIAMVKGFRSDLTTGLEQKLLLAVSGKMLQKGILPDSLSFALQQLAADTTNVWQAEALKWLAIQEGKNMGCQYAYLALQQQDSMWTQELISYTNRMNREQNLREEEFNATKDLQQRWLSAILVAFALLLGGGIYTAAEYRRRHELDRIRTILYQKEQVIQILEREKEDSASLRHQIQEKTRQMEELAQRERKLKEMAELLHNKSRRLEDLSRQMEEMENLRKQLEQKQREWTETEADIRRSHLYDMPVARRLPAPGNPHKPQKEDFDGFLVAPDRQKAFLAEMDRCFNRFATGLMDITPGLTEEDTVYCCLFRLEIRPTDIATLMARTKSSVSKRRVRIELKLSGKDIPAPQ